MNSKLIVILFLLGLGVWWFSTQNLEAPQSTEDEVSMTEKPQTIRNMLSSGESVMCNYGTSTDSTTTEGSIYVSGGNIRGDFTTTNGTTTASHMIIMNNTSYIWNEGQPTGYMMTSIQEEVKSDGEAMPEGESERPTIQEPVDLDAPGDYNCSPWSPDPSMFELPSEVDFVDFSTMMEGGAGKLMETTPTGY